MSARTFPVLSDTAGRCGSDGRRENRWTLRSVPWRFIETHRAQAERNHGQTLERLAERGGLTPAEMLCAIEGKSLRAYGDESAAEVRIRNGVAALLEAEEDAT
jgi:hypothetical protein